MQNSVNADGIVLTGPCSKAKPHPTTPSFTKGIDGDTTPGLGTGGGVEGRGREDQNEPSRQRRKQPKLSRTRSHDPELGYGALKHYIAKSQDPL